MIIRMSAEDLDRWELDHGQKLTVGTVCTVAYKKDINRPAVAWYELIPGDNGGIPGNMDRTVRRYHGWRGTTNNVSTEACGVHEVTAIQAYKNGNVKITLGPDLRPDEP